MRTQASIGPVATWAAKILGGIAIGFCGSAFVTAASSGDDAPAPTKVTPASQAAAEAPTGFDNKTNGFEDQAAFDKDRGTFEEVEAIKDGWGRSITRRAVRAATRTRSPAARARWPRSALAVAPSTRMTPAQRKCGLKSPPAGRSCSSVRSTPRSRRSSFPEYDVRTLRMSNTVLGNGFVEVIPDEEILRVRNRRQRWGMEGFAVVVPSPWKRRTGADGKTEFMFVERSGRFGWKCQEASAPQFQSRAHT